MDIVVTLPKKERLNLEKERAFLDENGPENCTQYWSIGRKPTNLRLKDRIYFVEDGLITHYNLFMGYAVDPVCEVTGRDWPGLNLILKCPRIMLKAPVPMRGFQGFRYMPRVD